MFFIPSLFLGLFYWLLFSIGQVVIVANRWDFRWQKVLTLSLAYWAVIALLVFASQFNDALFVLFGWPVLFLVSLVSVMINSLFGWDLPQLAFE